MNRLPHVWGPWREHLSIRGETTGLAVRGCEHCTHSELVIIPTLCQWRGTTKRRWRLRRR